MDVVTPTRRERALQLHRFLKLHAFYPLLLCMILALGFVLTRAVLMQQPRYASLVKNLLFAWIPYWCALMLSGWERRGALTRGRFVIVGAAWLVWFPNAPYMITDFVHLHDHPPLAWWFEIGLIATFALAGCFLGAASLRIMHDFVRRRGGDCVGWAFVLAATMLCGFGIYLGRIQRWNSWDVVLRPRPLAAQIFERLADPLAHMQTIGVTLMFGAMTLAIYLMFAAAGGRDTNDA